MNHKKESFTIQVDSLGCMVFNYTLEKNVSRYTVLTSKCKSVTLHPTINTQDILNFGIDTY